MPALDTCAKRFEVEHMSRKRNAIHHQSDEVLEVLEVLAGLQDLLGLLAADQARVLHVRVVGHVEEHAVDRGHRVRSR